MNEKILLFLRSLKDTSWTSPEGRFQAARIVCIDPYSKDRDIFFTVPVDKMEWKFQSAVLRFMLKFAKILRKRNPFCR